MTLSVELIHDRALNLLSEMEKLRLIRINDPSRVSEKLSQRFAGALRLSDDEYDAFQKKLKDDRNEWAYCKPYSN